MRIMPLQRFSIKQVSKVLTGAVIVAAGMSSRMKAFKPLMKLGNLTIAEHVVVNFQHAGIQNIVMVTGLHADELEKRLLKYGITFLKNEKYETTQMFDSVKIGLSYLEKRCESILFCPADIPLFTGRTVDELLNSEGKLVFPVYHGKTGHPVRIDTSLIPEIMNYKGDMGLRGALDSLPVKPVKLQVEDEGTVVDADTKEDYKYLLKIYQSGFTKYHAEETAII